MNHINKVFLKLKESFGTSRGEFLLMYNRTKELSDFSKSTLEVKEFSITEGNKTKEYYLLHTGIYLVLVKQGDIYKSFSTERITNEYYKTLTLNNKEKVYG